MKIVTFFAGPLVSIPSLSLAARGQDGAQPDAEIADDHAAGHVQEADPTRAITHSLICFILETGKRGVSAQNSDHQEQTPIGVGLPSFSKQRHQNADQEGTSDVDNERAEGKTTAVFLHDPGTGEIASQSAEPGT